jgi:prepilin peptidase CpaA
MMTDLVFTAAGLAFAVALLDAALSDLRCFRISNRAPLLLVAAFVPAVLAAGLPPDALLWRLAAAAAAFAVCAALFVLKVWGGGDAKLVPAVVLWTGFGGLARFLLIMALVGGGLAVVALLSGRLKQPGAAGRLRRWGVRLAESGHVPYGVAIAAGGLDWWAATIMPRLANLPRLLHSLIN